MRTLVIACIVAAGCKSERKPAPAPPPPPGGAIDAATTATTPTDAGQPWYAVPVDARPQGAPIAPADLPDLGDGSTGAIQLHAVDAPAFRLVLLMPVERSLAVGVPGDALVRGRIAAASRAALLERLHAAAPDAVPALVKAGKGKTPDVDLSFGAAPIRDLYRLFSDIERRNYVVERGQDGKLDILARRVPSDVVATAVAGALGLAIDTIDNVRYVRVADHPGFDRALVDTGGPIVDVDFHGARAGEAYTALASVGANKRGGGPCGGDPFDLRLRKVKAGVALAAIASITGVAPGANTPCPLVEAVRKEVKGLRGIVVRGKSRAAIVDMTSGAALASSDDADLSGIGTGYYDRSPTAAQPDTIALYPPDPNAPSYDLIGDRPKWVDELATARLAATLIDGKRQVAVVELANGEWHALDSTDHHLTMVQGFRFTIAPGTLGYAIAPDDPTQSPSEHELVLRAR